MRLTRRFAGRNQQFYTYHAVVLGSLHQRNPERYQLEFKIEKNCETAEIKM